MKKEEKIERHSRAWELFNESMKTKIICIACQSKELEVGVEVKLATGISVDTTYTCLKCKLKFMEKDVYEAEVKDNFES